MATVPSIGQFPNYFHSVDTILGFQKDVFCKQDIISKRFKDTFSDKNWPPDVSLQSQDVKDTTMKTCKGIATSYFYYFLSFYLSFFLSFFHLNVFFLSLF